MKHHCYCGIREHFKQFRAKKLGLVGGAFLALHLLFHVVECLILPSILVGLGGHLAEEPVSALGDDSAMVNPVIAPEATWHHDFADHTFKPFDQTDFYCISL